jgi:hypothetical protein
MSRPIPGGDEPEWLRRLLADDRFELDWLAEGVT